MNLPSYIYLHTLKHIQLHTFTVLHLPSYIYLHTCKSIQLHTFALKHCPWYHVFWYKGIAHDTVWDHDENTVWDHDESCIHEMAMLQGKRPCIVVSRVMLHVHEFWSSGSWVIDSSYVCLEVLPNVWYKGIALVCACACVCVCVWYKGIALDAFALIYLVRYICLNIFDLMY